MFLSYLQKNLQIVICNVGLSFFSSYIAIVTPPNDRFIRGAEKLNVRLLEKFQTGFDTWFKLPICFKIVHISEVVQRIVGVGISDTQKD